MQTAQSAWGSVAVYSPVWTVVFAFFWFSAMAAGAAVFSWKQECSWLRRFTGITFRAYSYYNRTGGNDDDERPINGHTAAHPAAASELRINGFDFTNLNPGQDTREQTTKRTHERRHAKAHTKAHTSTDQPTSQPHTQPTNRSPTPRHSHTRSLAQRPSSLVPRPTHESRRQFALLSQNLLVLKAIQHEPLC